MIKRALLAAVLLLAASVVSAQTLEQLATCQVTASRRLPNGHMRMGRATGVIVAVKGKEAVCLTNYHVIHGHEAKTFSIGVPNVGVFAAKVIFWGTSRDVATLLFTCTKELKPVRIARVVRPGEKIYTYGYPACVTKQVKRWGKILSVERDNIFARMNVQAVGGVSGSGWFNESNEMVALCWAHDGNGRNDLGKRPRDIRWVLDGT